MGKIILGVILLFITAVVLYHMDLFRSMHPYMSENEIRHELIMESLLASGLGIAGVLLVVFGLEEDRNANRQG